MNEPIINEKAHSKELLRVSLQLQYNDPHPDYYKRRGSGLSLTGSRVCTLTLKETLLGQQVARLQACAGL
jgi:hypothetical protein